ncbi:FAD-dependent oxidoreductase [Herbiconiux sp. VKM Ac-1786]|uniref:NAD(P)/FAD-dependent oxidoreductase n=1 Tax=Herbiconiux sp. VKM Ac-1786 TaxID=2783824 RepID=UPI001889D038|nr:FAD-binding oxidoreductase [Herbiconiux sp. VKM Ac-1786]MBF4573296.1 FAD-dependent oxidoreductase [Herbiconiux sp. VKM Ac-1786]
MTATDYRDLSFWFDSLAGSGRDDLTPRPGLAGDQRTDVCIIGGGLTGLWTAYYLKRANPSLAITIVEKHIAGFGASGRNGGWCSALFPTSTAGLRRAYGDEAAIAMRQAMIDTVDEVGRVVAAEDIDCDYAKGGTITFARGGVQLAAARAEVEAASAFGPDRLELVTPSTGDTAGGPGTDDGRGNTAGNASPGQREVDAGDRRDVGAVGGVPSGAPSSRSAALRQALGATGASAASFDPSCARLQPAKLVRGLAAVVERMGVVIAEQTEVVEWAPRRVLCQGAAGQSLVHCDTVVIATEGYGATLPGVRRRILPLYSLMIATEPLPAALWDELGIEHGTTFSDYRHLLVYGQRTADDRFAFGGRGARYHWGSSITPDHDRSAAVFAHLERALIDLFPAAEGAEVTHRWGGPLGVPRDWHASASYNPRTGVAFAGGYVGDGLSTTNLAGRTLADLIGGRETELTGLPWVNHRSPRWEPEPLRFIGANLGLLGTTAADAEEALTGRPSIAARLLGPLTGH